MREITVIIISKDDQDVIGDAIESAKKLTDKIVVIDANRDDNTERLCRKLGAEVIKHPFKDFSDQRNFAISHVTTAWVLYLDSDERLTDEFCLEVKNLLKGIDSSSDMAGFRIFRKTFYFGVDWHFQDKVERLFLKSKFIKWSGVVHETPKVNGRIEQIYSPIVHLTHRNLSQMIRKTNEWSDYEADLRYRSSHPQMVPWRFARVMGSAFYNSYIKNKGYKNGTYGLIESIYQSFSMFVTYAKLWEMQIQRKKN